MIISCPFCEAKFLVPAQNFAGGGRRVRCARCTHAWHVNADGGGATENQPPSSPEPPRADPNPAPHTDAPVTVAAMFQSPTQPVTAAMERKGVTPPWLLRLFRIIGLSFLAVIFFWIVLDRQAIVARWPMFEKAYETIGLHIVHTGEGLNIENLRYEIIYESGAMKLVVNGVIDNETKYKQVVPNIKASALGADGQPILSWQIDAPAKVIDGFGKLSFQSSVKAPTETVANLKLEYLELPHD